MTVRTAADVFLDSLGNPNTVRNYGTGVGKTAERLGEARPPASVADDEIGARAPLDEHTAMRGPGPGWDLHEYRHASLTRLGEQGAPLLMLMAKSRHKKPENVRRYFKPSPEAIAQLTSLLAPGDRKR
ncbi:hypothetical protein OH786_36890 (plasmid) [Streptomyces atratus]|uniref:hypothetical protein n=1 Tax=Streptomyces atratus TaxID=1893 RepID=UPI002109BF8E|nr:hypothetical protein [Streptomyces atratus]